MIKDITLTELVVKRIRNLFEEKNISAYRVALNAKINPCTINHVLSGNRKDIRLSTITNICKGLDITLYEFFNDDLFR